MPQMRPVSSSMIRAVGYEAEESTLYVQFQNGVTWEYDNVPESEADALMNSSSVGQFFNNTIKNSYDGREV